MNDEAQSSIQPGSFLRGDAAATHRPLPYAVNVRRDSVIRRSLNRGPRPRRPLEPREAVSFRDLGGSAISLNDLRSPPGNHLEAVRGDWKGFHSIRINDQWRIVFRWSDAQAHDVRIIDYHRG